MFISAFLERVRGSLRPGTSRSWAGLRASEPRRRNPERSRGS